MNALNDVATIKTVTGSARNVNGFKTDTYMDTTVFCEIKSATYGEYYAAFGVNIKVQRKILIDVRDYESAIYVNGNKRIKPSLVELNGDTYTIVRMYQTNDSQCELSLSEVE